MSLIFAILETSEKEINKNKKICYINLKKDFDNIKEDDTWKALKI